jgi:hypothetical protein
MPHAHACLFFKKNRPSSTLKEPYKTRISGYTHQALFETLNLTLKFIISLFLNKFYENIEGFKAVSNYLDWFLEMAISNSYGVYTGLLRHQLGNPPE